MKLDLSARELLDFIRRFEKLEEQMANVLDLAGQLTQAVNTLQTNVDGLLAEKADLDQQAADAKQSEALMQAVIDKITSINNLLANGVTVTPAPATDAPTDAPTTPDNPMTPPIPPDTEVLPDGSALPDNPLTPDAPPVAA